MSSLSNLVPCNSSSLNLYINLVLLVLQANNILVGWSLTKPPKSSNPPSLGSTAAPVSPGAAILARRSDSLEGILGHLAAPPQGSVSDDPSHPPSSTSSSSSAGTSSSSAPSTSSLTTPSCLASSGSIPHKALTAAIDLGLKLPSSQVSPRPCFSWMGIRVFRP